MLPFIPIVKRWLIINNFTSISYCLLTSNAIKPQLHFWTLESLWYKFRIELQLFSKIHVFLIYGWCCIINTPLSFWDNSTLSGKRSIFHTMSDKDTWDLRDSRHGYRTKFWRWSNAPWLSHHSFQRVFHTRRPRHDTSCRYLYVNNEILFYFKLGSSKTSWFICARNRNFCWNEPKLWYDQGGACCSRCPAAIARPGRPLRGRESVTQQKGRELQVARCRHRARQRR